MTHPMAIWGATNPPLFFSLSLYIYTHDYNSMLLLLLLRSVLFRLANTDRHNMCVCVFRGHIQTIAPRSRCYRRRRSSDSIDYSFQLVYTAQRLRRYNTTQERKQKQKRQKIIAQLGASSYKMGIQIKYNQIVGWSTLYMRIRFGSFKTRSTLPGANLIARGEVWNGGDGWQQQQKKTGARMLDPFIPDEQHVTSVGNLFRLIQGSIGSSRSSAFFCFVFPSLCSVLFIHQKWDGKIWNDDDDIRFETQRPRHEAAALRKLEGMETVAQQVSSHDWIINQHF